MKTRSLLYLIASLLGDFQAIKRGLIVKRIQRRILGRISGKGLFRKLIKSGRRR